MKKIFFEDNKSSCLYVQQASGQNVTVNEVLTIKIRIKFVFMVFVRNRMQFSCHKLVNLSILMANYLPQDRLINDIDKMAIGN